MRSPANQAARLFDDHFVGKQKSRRAVVKLHQQHMTPEIIHRAQNARFFAKSAQPFMVSYRLEQTTTPPNHRLEICTFHVHHCPSTRQAPPPALLENAPLRHIAMIAPTDWTLGRRVCFSSTVC